MLIHHGRFFVGKKIILKRRNLMADSQDPILHTTSIYNASVVKIYNATNSMARFYNKNIFFSDVKTLLPTTTLAF
jgi:hypothetical protein